jgi:hypothetical protein
MSYKTYFTNEPAGRDGKDLLLQIHVGDEAAYVHCGQLESVGDHNGRKVIFDVDRACKLKFDHEEVFGTNEKRIAKGTTPITVVVETRKTAWTHCEVEPNGAAKVPPTKHRSPPVIVVP